MVLLQGSVSLRNVSFRYLSPNPFYRICFHLFARARGHCLQGLLAVFKEVIDDGLVKLLLLGVLLYFTVRVKRERDHRTTV